MDFDFYPKKPELIEEKPKSNLSVTVFSILLFILTLLFVFSDEVNFIFQLVIVLMVHELGHFAMMKLFKYRHVRMFFVPLMGAFVQGSKEVYSQRQSLIVIGTGPFPGILIGAMLIYFSSFSHIGWMVDLGLLFLFLNILNLLPLDPLDGGQLFKLMIRKKEDLFLLVFSFISSLILIAVGFYMDSWLIMGFGFVMGVRVRSLQKQYFFRERLTSEGIIYETTYRDLSDTDYERIKTFLMKENNRIQEYLGYLNPEEADQFLAQHVSSVLKSPVKKDAGFLFKLILILLWVSIVFAPFVLLVFGAEWIKENYSWYFEYLSAK
jgi:Zn-dependent protease